MLMSIVYSCLLLFGILLHLCGLLLVDIWGADIFAIIHSFTGQIFLEHLLRARYYFRPWDRTVIKTDKIPSPVGILGVENYNK